MKEDECVEWPGQNGCGQQKLEFMKNIRTESGRTRTARINSKCAELGNQYRVSPKTIPSFDKLASSIASRTTLPRQGPSRPDAAWCRLRSAAICSASAAAAAAAAAAVASAAAESARESGAGL